MNRTDRTDPTDRPIVIVESPYAGNVEMNLAYARAAVRDCILRGEAPFASHLLYTQPGILEDDIPAERQVGIEVGLTFGRVASSTVVYADLGVSAGMQKGIERAIEEDRVIEFRSLPDWIQSRLADAEKPE